MVVTRAALAVLLGHHERGAVGARTSFNAWLGTTANSWASGATRMLRRVTVAADPVFGQSGRTSARSRQARRRWRAKLLMKMLSAKMKTLRALRYTRSANTPHNTSRAAVACAPGACDGPAAAGGFEARTQSGDETTSGPVETQMRRRSLQQLLLADKKKSASSFGARTARLGESAARTGWWRCKQANAGALLRPGLVRGSAQGSGERECKHTQSSRELLLRERGR